MKNWPRQEDSDHAVASEVLRAEELPEVIEHPNWMEMSLNGRSKEQ